MSRWLIFIQAIFSYEIPKLMAARDSHEFREDLIELSMFNFLYFGGDAIISGLLAQHLQKKKGLNALQGISLTQPMKLFGRQFQRATTLTEMYKLVPDRNHPAFKAAKKIFFVGLLGSAAGLGLFNIANYKLTEFKAKKQQKVFNHTLIQPLLKLLESPSAPVRASSA